MAAEGPRRLREAFGCSFRRRRRRSLRCDDPRPLAADAPALGTRARGSLLRGLGPPVLRRVRRLGPAGLLPSLRRGGGRRGTALAPRRKAHRQGAERAPAAWGLPLSPAASVFVRAASDRLDKARAMLTGPEGTPYFGGCFLFDVFFPARYPDVPPCSRSTRPAAGAPDSTQTSTPTGKSACRSRDLARLRRFRKVGPRCQANLWRVLVSIQGMILVADPYFNEPGVDAVRGTPEGDARRHGTTHACLSTSSATP